MCRHPHQHFGVGSHTITYPFGQFRQAVRAFPKAEEEIDGSKDPARKDDIPGLIAAIHLPEEAPSLSGRDRVPSPMSLG